MGTYLTMFVTAWVSATLWPMASEAVFIGFLVQNNGALLLLLAAAFLGNSLGSITMFELAKSSSQWLAQRRQQQQAKLLQASTYVQRYGPSLLLLAWLPIIGDLLPLAAGVVQLKRWPVYVAISLGKLARYTVVMAVTLNWMSS